MVLLKILFAVHSKHFSFWPSPDVQPMSNVLLHAIPWQCMFYISVCILWSLCLEWIFIIIHFKASLSKRFVTFTPALSDNSQSRESLLSGRLSTVDLLVLTTSVHLLFILKILLNLDSKQVTSMRRSTILRQCRKTTDLSYHRCLINTGVEKMNSN